MPQKCGIFYFRNKPKGVEFFFKTMNLRGKSMNKPKSITQDDAILIRHHLTGQDRLIFDFAVETGLRISDILNIRRNQIRKIMTIKESKTNKLKTVEISDGLLLCLPNHDFDDRLYLFSSPRSAFKPLHRSTYHRHIKKLSEWLKIDFSAHSMRKFYALNIFYTTEDIFAAQKALNHKYITTTCSYLDIDLNALLKTVAKETRPHA